MHPRSVESGCTYPLVPGGDTRTSSWPVTILAMPPDGRISFIPMTPQETRLVGVTTYDVPVHPQRPGTPDTAHARAHAAALTREEPPYG
ncbi:hypothetical protein ACWD11_35015 [Streptomyces sp. NPDC002776]